MNQSLSVVNSDLSDFENKVSLGTLQAITPTALVSGAAEMAKELANIINKQHLFTNIKGKNFVTVEGWTTLATMLGCVPREVSTTEEDGVYVAVVELIRLSNGACIGRASAECGEESPWSGRAKYARRSMAQTRATSKACRLAFSWIMKLAGYEVTPAEEMQPLVDATPLRITASQLKLLEAQIRDYGLDQSRVEKWVATAWRTSELRFLTPEMFENLLIRLEKWAQEYSANNDSTFSEAPRTYAERRG